MFSWQPEFVGHAELERPRADNRRRVGKGRSQDVESAVMAALARASQLPPYLISIGIAWLVGPPRETTPSREDLPAIRLVFAAAAIDHARKDTQANRRDFMSS